MMRYIGRQLAACLSFALLSIQVAHAAPAPSLALQRAQADVDKTAAAAAKANTDYRKVVCQKNSGAAAQNAATTTLLRANSNLDLYIREEALMSPDVKDASLKSDDASMAELRARSNHGSASALAAAHTAKTEALEKAERLFHKRMAAVHKRVSRGGYDFGIPNGRCRG